MRKRGFTLIEIMVVMAIIAVLAVLVIGAITLARRSAIETTHRNNTKSLVAAFHHNFGIYKRYCGATAGEVPCSAPQTYQAIADIDVNGNPLVKLNPACAGNATNAGGGRLTAIGISTVTLNTVQWDCTTDMAASDIITLN